MDKNEKEKRNTDIVRADGEKKDIAEHTPSSESEKNEKTKRKKSGSHTVGGYIISSAALLIAFVFMIGALFSTPKEGTADTPVFDEEESSAEESRKYIYVRDISEEGMSTSEIYTACADTVVSIVTESAKSTGVGSGFILSENGYIATAAHVVEEADNITVILADGSEYRAQIKASDTFTDLAVLKIDAENLETVRRGSSADLLAGERVVAIGTPASLDYAGSVCSGEISFPKRTVKIYGEDGALFKKMTLIQTDAPVNHGNSGCPLFDSEGRVIGIVTMKLGQNFSGVGFAIPADGAFAILDKMVNGFEVGDELIAAVSVPAAKLGAVAEACEISGIYGVRINKFISNEYDAAQKLKLGDLITHVGGTAVTSAKKLSDAVNDHAPNDTVQITVYREGQTLTFDVVLGR